MRCSIIYEEKTCLFIPRKDIQEQLSPNTGKRYHPAALHRNQGHQRLSHDSRRIQQSARLDRTGRREPMSKLKKQNSAVAIPMALK